LISFTSQEALEQQLNHIKVPLAELIKEQISWNPWFDFHTETHNWYILFWEAKYQFHSNPHKDAIDQIKLFITKKKDDSELELISKFVSQRASNNYLDNKKTYAASFSVKWKKISQILKTALKHIDVAPLNSYPELYIIWIEIQ
jgi:hypothetical protein